MTGRFLSFMEAQQDKRYLTLALRLSVITILYNIAEGLFSVFFGAQDDSLSLMGFGADSFVEVISGAGILHMTLRMRKSSVETRDIFERNALRITSVAFFILCASLVAGSLFNIRNHSKPETTVAGIIISLISLLTMYFLMKAKLLAGKKLSSAAIIADAHCTRTCLYLSFILLLASLLYEILKISYIDIAGSLGIAYFAFKEGKEAWEKSRSGLLQCSCQAGTSCKDNPEK